MWNGFDMNMLTVPLRLLWQRGIVDSPLTKINTSEGCDTCKNGGSHDYQAGNGKKSQKSELGGGFHQVMEDLLRDF